MPSQRKLKFAPIVLDRLQKLGQRDIDIIRENVVAIRDDPQHAGHPSSLSRAKRLALQHVCPHSWVVLYRWQGHDPTHPSGVITVEDLVEMYC